MAAPGELARLASLCSRLPDVSRGYRVDVPSGISVPWMEWPGREWAGAAFSQLARPA